MIEKGSKVTCKSSLFLSSDAWLLKGKTYTVKNINDHWVWFEEIRNKKAKISKNNLNTNFYSIIEMRKIKLKKLDNT